MSIIRIPVRIEHNQGGGPAMNVWHVRIAGTASSNRDVLEDAVTRLKAFYTSFAGEMGPANAYLGEGMIEDPLTDPKYVDDFPQTVVLGSGRTPAPVLLALCISWRTTSASRSGRGRTFIGPIGKDAVDGTGTPANGVVNIIRSSAAALVSDSMGTNGWAFGVLSQKQGVLRDFTGSSVTDKWSYLSSRRD